MKQHDPSNLQQLLGNKSAIERLSKSPEAQALVGKLSQGQDQEALKKMAEGAAKGDTGQLKQLIQSVMKDPETAALLQRLSDTMGTK